MQIADAKYVHSLIVEGREVEAANFILDSMGQKDFRAHKKSQAVFILQGALQNLLDNELYLHAATLQWGPEMFNTEPESTVRVFEALTNGSLILLMGASSMSKTYAAGAFYLLDYLRDPLFTTVKLAAVNEDHLKQNLFAHVVTLYRSCAIPCRYKIDIRDTALWMGIKDAGNEFGISGIAFKQSQETSGQFKGYKAKPARMKRHPKFGFLSRLRVLGDEGQNWPGGPFKDFNSLIASREGKELIKVAVAFNPEDISQHVVKQAEPVDGWVIEDVERLHDYESKSGWRVCRLDAKLCENVKQRKVVYHGLQTYEAYMGYLKAGGDTSANYFCADTKTEVMSNRGWLRHDQVSIGDEIYTVNTHTGLASWEKVEEVFSKHLDGHLVSMEGRGFSALVTDNHRWAVTDKGRLERPNSERLVFKETKDLKKFDLIPLSAQPGDLPASDEYGADICELIGWVLSDGTFQELGYKHLGTKVCVNQSILANPQKCARIRALFGRLKISIWEQEFNGIKFFNFSGGPAMRVRQVLKKNKHLSFDFLNSLTAESLLGLYEGMLLGDGGFQGGATRYFCQKDEVVASQFSYICARLGMSTTSHVRHMKTKFGEADMTYVNVRKSLTTRPENMDICVIPYSGIVWCPRTKNGTFYARRNGTTYFTGNTFARGFPPISGNVNTVIPPSWPQMARGEATFIETPSDYAAVDLAFMGKDSAQMAVGRWGLASGWRDEKNIFHQFNDRLNVAKAKPRHVLQIDQILPLQKHDNTTLMAEEIMGKCNMMRIKADNVSIDKTGYGFGTWSHLREVWGDVLGISWGEGATSKKIVSGDMETADKQCDGVMSEMWWALRKWLEPSCRAVLINPIISTQPIHTQMTSRRMSHGKKGIKVEPKEDYMARNNNSPDESDAIVMLIHLIRMRSHVLPGLVEEDNARISSPDIKLVPIMKMISTETDDSIYEGPQNDDDAQA